MVKYPPFDLAVYDHPLVYRLKPFPGAFLRLLVEDYWKTGLPLPESDYDLSNLIGTDQRTWRRFKPVVVPALEAIMTQIIENREKKIKVYRKLVKNVERTRSFRKKKSKVKNTLLSDFDDNHTGFTAIPERQEFNPGMHDKHERSAAIQASKASEHPKLKDK